MVADGAHNELSCCGLDRAFTHVVEERRAKVARHDDDRVAEVDYTALTIGQPTVIENLEEELVELPGCLLDFVDEDDRVRLPPDVLGELATLVVTDVARRSTDETSDRVLLRVLRTVDTNHGVR